jgi:hypothetical protein
VHSFMGVSTEGWEWAQRGDVSGHRRMGVGREGCEWAQKDGSGHRGM